MAKVTGHENRLATEKSPYLLQHAANPVDWYAWGPEAFEKARREDKPIFLSIGYSTCHWCHVMAHESFEDLAVAKLMNDAFVNIKVDREERPDIDAIYMHVCQMTTGTGGWPLTIVMTPEKRPFFAGTYFPKTGRFGRPGMLELVPLLEDAWTKRRDEILRSAESITSAVQEMGKAPGGKELGEATLTLAYSQLAQRFDEEHGGFGHAPKFPTPHVLLFLLRYWRRTGAAEALRMVEVTLQGMRRGGIYDHVGFGFHRYSTDESWFLPHFEKMLYDQAQLALASTEAAQATGNEDYAATAQEILAYVLRDMTAPEGGFYSAEDADSEGVEGKFYAWSREELREVLGKEDGDLVADLHGTERGGNFHDEASHRTTGTNILHLPRPIADSAMELGIPERQLRARLAAARERLFAAREQRIHPHKDDKILTDWNGLMIKAFAKAGQAFGVPKYVEAARRAADFCLTQMRDGSSRLLHRYRAGAAGLPAHLDDYAFLIDGLVELHQATQEVGFLKDALWLTDEMVLHFWDAREGAFFLTADDAEELLVRPKEITDGAVPSGNSVAMLAMLRLARLAGRTDLEEKAARIPTAFSASIARSPAGHTQLMVALDLGIGPSHEVVIAGRTGAADTRKLLDAVRRAFVPNAVVLHRPTDESEPIITTLARYTRDLTAREGKATAYVCENTVCNRPVTDPAAMLGLLGVSRSPPSGS